MANTYDRVKMTHMGDMRFTMTEITGDGADTSVTNTDIGLHRIIAAWIQDIDDGASLALSWTATEITLSAAITATEKQMLFAIGY